MFFFSSRLGNSSIACFDDQLRQSAAMLRFFRDSNYKTWPTELEKNPSTFFAKFLDKFYSKYRDFLTSKKEEAGNEEDLLNKVIEDDILNYK
jgi:hypothetical protein